MKYRRASDIRVGVVGYGAAFNMGPAHLNGMRSAGMTPAAVCEKDPARLEVAARDFPGIGTYTSLADMLRQGEVDLVTLITPHNTHASLACQCLAAGKHVVVEKPMALTTQECDRMIAQAKKTATMLSVYHNRHWDGCILQAVKTIRSGAIGEVVRIEGHMGGWHQPGNWWRSSRSISGGVLYDWGVHVLEYTLQLAQGKIVEVTGFSKSGVWAGKTAWGEDTNEDEAFLVVRYENGAWSTLTMSSIESKPKEGILEITGTKGTYVMDHGSWTLITHRRGETVSTRGNNPPSEGQRFYRNLAAHLTKDEPLIITAEWARRPIHVIDLACRSARQGRALRARYG